MEKENHEATTFAEVFTTTGIAYHQQIRQTTPDNRPMIYFQGMKVYIPDSFNPETVLKLLQIMKKL